MTSKIIHCECGSAVQKYGLKRHLKSQKHRRYLGEEIIKTRVIDESKLWVCMHRKTKDCTPEQLQRRREYIARKMREHRARKKEAINLIDDEDEDDEIDITPLEITLE